MSEKKISIVTRNWCSDEYCDYARYAVVELTLDSIDKIFRLRDLFLKVLESEPKANELRVRDGSVSYYDGPPELDDLPDALSPEDVAETIFNDNGRVAVTGFESQKEESEVDVEEIIVRAGGVEWSASPDHTNLYVQTGELSYKFLQQVRNLLTK